MTAQGEQAIADQVRGRPLIVLVNRVGLPQARESGVRIPPELRIAHVEDEPTRHATTVAGGCHWCATAAHLTFGESAGTNEMCVLTGLYYPAPGGRPIIGDVALGKTFLAQ